MNPHFLIQYIITETAGGIFLYFFHKLFFLLTNDIYSYTVLQNTFTNLLILLNK